MSILFTLLSVAGVLAAIVTLPGTGELLLLSVAGLFPSRSRTRRSPARAFRLAVVVPAHNEELNIAGCVRSLFAAARTGIEATVAVVADNCEDRTAVQAAEAGARVLVREDAIRRGKGYALDFAFGILLPEGFEACLVVDADSSVSSNLLTETVAALLDGADATQCGYVVRNSGDSVRTRLLHVALLAFNILRPRGRDRLGLSAGIYGNGFALPAQTLREVPYTADSVVEDLEFHLALVRAGKQVRFLPHATVYGEMPVAGAGVKTQRARWEGGRLRMLSENCLPLLRDILKGRVRLIEPCLDLLLLPLAFHVLLLLLAAFAPFWPARLLGLSGFAVVGLHLFAAIRAGGGNLNDVAVLAAAPFYMLWKVLLLPRVLASSRSQAAWVRTERAGEKKLP